MKAGDNVKIKDRQSKYHDKEAIISDLSSVISGQFMVEIDGKIIGSCRVEFLEKVRC
ncbi:MAG: hypothetical protein JXM74_04620 [Fusobacteriaceae bacterium]|nr:hypothetical protein [Fusobacteriaceae bacterium]MBN2838019.1 hypothetical protein [Fusobacteriaceae bacterium]